MIVTLSFRATEGPQQVQELTLRVDTTNLLDALSKALAFAESVISIPVSGVVIRDIPPAKQEAQS